MDKVQYAPLTPEHFSDVIALGNRVHGDNYLNYSAINQLYHRSFENQINASWVALSGNKLIGFRLTISKDHWQPDRWCSPDQWQIAADKVCYFKCNTVDEAFRGQGLGSQLLAKSIESARSQGAKAGLAHIWLASPGNSAFRYFSKCGGILIKQHPGKWAQLSVEDGYLCPICPGVCECVAAEMLIRF